MTTVRFRAPKFFSELDEELFFIGLRLVPCVRSYVGAVPISW